jgi:hypothetical protein
VSECDREALIIRRHWSTEGCCATEKVTKVVQEGVTSLKFSSGIFSNNNIFCDSNGIYSCFGSFILRRLVRDKVVTIHAWKGPDVSRSSRLLDFKTIDT